MTYTELTVTQTTQLTHRYVVRPWHATKKRTDETDGLMAKWRVLAEKVGKEWKGGGAVEDIRVQRAHSYDHHD